ncbi:MAG: hypothetical protein HQL30_05225 [Candidatus Omnitrophica bacterium]|nr:hypothetical protein [Candidatus Omnitrophota bacterium]
MEKLVLGLVAAAAIFEMARHVMNTFNEGRAKRGCAGCGGKCGVNKSGNKAVRL